MKKYYEYRSEVPDYQPGDLVYLERTNLTSSRFAQKFDDRRFGPFKVLKKVGERAGIKAEFTPFVEEDPSRFPYSPPPTWTLPSPNLSATAKTTSACPY